VPSAGSKGRGGEGGKERGREEGGEGEEEGEERRSCIKLINYQVYSLLFSSLLFLASSSASFLIFHKVKGEDRGE
jgi:hypothetical protein